ncbi:MAG: hypothetical protein NT065_01480 [Chlamydiae bacterium]|nr:hypothetical protein [Chlamydiota bacterium]
MEISSFYMCSLFCFITAGSMAATNLDQQMSLQDKQQTGIVNLTLKQRQSLALWIDRYYVPIDDPSSPNGSKIETGEISKNQSLSAQSETFLLMKNLNGGKQLILNDLRQWVIDPEDVSITQKWEESAQIRVEQGFDTAFPFILMNMKTDEGVKARLSQTTDQPSSTINKQEGAAPKKTDTDGAPTKEPQATSEPTPEASSSPQSPLKPSP